MTIAQADITPTVTLNGWTYGTEANTPNVSGNSGNGEVNYQYKVSTAEDSTYATTTPSDAGNYTVKATIAQTANYNGAETTVNFTISPRSVTVSGITAENKPYDGSTAATLDYSDVAFNRIVEADAGKLTVEATGTFENADAGENKTVNISDLKLGGDRAANYALASSGNQSETTATVSPKALTVTAEAQSKTYGEDDPELTYTATGVVHGETETVMSGALSRVTGEDVGDYAIKQGTLSADNYEMPSANVVVTPAFAPVKGSGSTSGESDAIQPANTLTAETPSNSPTVESPVSPDETGVSDG